MPRLRLFLILLLPWFTSPLLADEWWAWTLLEFHHQPPWSAGVFLGNRADMVDGSYVQIISPRVKYAALPWLDLGIGLSTLSIENPQSGLRHWQLRPELEINPHIDFSPHLKLEWRNRMEWRWNEEEALTTHRSRHRLQLGWTLPRPIGLLTRIFANEELLMDLHLKQRSENRLSPLGLTFHLSEHRDLDLFYMIVSRRNRAEWQHESILGTYLRLRF